MKHVLHVVAGQLSISVNSEDDRHVARSHFSKQLVLSLAFVFSDLWLESAYFNTLLPDAYPAMTHSLGQQARSINLSPIIT